MPLVTVVFAPGVSPYQGCAVLGLDLALERQSWTGLHPSAHWLPGIPPSGLARGKRAPHRAGQGGLFGEWGAQRGEALTLPAAMGELREGLLEGHLSCVLMDLRYHRSMASDHMGPEMGS